ncbi:hypothetical protein CL6EHI_154760 [Entamoeba histolytica]|uniref:Capsid protein n=1 Tax=Entamoeba histolytica TaxID=5759 RepID=A0A175JZ94_ENTHI|nr:hypothetical protein CL6EHI_154760 [Entamoeba histolytica]
MRRTRRATTTRPTSTRRNLRSTMAGNLKAAFQQRDSTQVVLNATETVQLAIPANTNGATTVMNVTKLLCGMEFFQYYAGMYDQFKIDGVSVSAEIVYNTFGQAAMTFPNVITAWDRNGIDKAVASQVTQEGQGVLSNVPIVPGPYQVSSYSSAVSRAYYPGARWGITRRSFASSLQEKSIYLPTVKTAEVLTESTLYAAWNPDFLLSVLLGNQTATCQTLVFNLTWSWVVSLRGLRKSTLDVIPTPAANSLGYANTNAGTVASGTNNAMIPVSMTTTNQGGVVTTDNPIYTSMVQTTGGQLSGSSNTWTVDSFKMYLNNVFYNAGISQVNAIDLNFDQFGILQPSTADGSLTIRGGSTSVMRVRLVVFATAGTLGSGVNGYNISAYLLGNANTNAHTVNIATDASTYVIASNEFDIFGINLPNISTGGNSEVKINVKTTTGSSTDVIGSLLYAYSETIVDNAVTIASGALPVVAGTVGGGVLNPVVLVSKTFVTELFSNDNQKLISA